LPPTLPCKKMRKESSQRDPPNESENSMHMNCTATSTALVHGR